MKAAIIQADRSLKVEDRPTPEPGPGDVLVKVAFCGICGSDLHLLEAGFLPPGSIIGHELSGTIEAVGEGVEGWAIGDRVCVMPIDPCFECPACGRGDIQVCHNGAQRSYGLGMKPGGFAQFMLVRPSMLFKLPSGLDFETAALNEPCAVAVHGVNIAGPRMSVQAIVMGAGPIGLLCIKALKAAGAGVVYASEPDPYRADLALKAGADRVVDPAKAAPGGEIRKDTGRGADFAFDCAGTEKSIDEAVFLIGRHGRIIVLGAYPAQATIFPLAWFAKEASLNFSFGYTYREFGNCLDLLANGVITPETVVSSVMPLADINEAFTLLKGSGQSKILINCQDV